MYNLAITFEATLVEPEKENFITKLFNRDFDGLSHMLHFRHEISTYQVQTSEEQYIAQTFDVRIRVRIETKLKKLPNYHNAAQLFQGYFGLISSLPYFHSSNVQVGCFE